MSKDGLYVVDGDQKTPFLRGMITHSLIARGLSFNDAYKAAQIVRDRVRHQGEISRADLSKLIRQVVEKEFSGHYQKKVPKAPPTILVQGERIFPFSKGVLSQSLQAAGIEPALGFDIARDIEAFLLQKGSGRVARDELRRLTYEALVRMGDNNSAERYLLWRLFRLDPNTAFPQGAERPLAILFGGATGTGKSSIAAEAAHRLGIRHVHSTDAIRQIMRLMFSRDLLPAIHASSFQAWQMEADAGDQSSVIEAFLEQSRRVVVGVRAILERAVQERLSLVVEGIHLVPGLLPLEEFKDRLHLVPVVVSTLKKKAHFSRFPQREEHSAQRSAERYRTYFSQIRSIQDYILEMADNHDIPIVDNMDLEETIPEVLSVVAGSLREKLELSRKELLRRALGEKPAKKKERD